MFFIQEGFCFDRNDSPRIILVVCITDSQRVPLRVFCLKLLPEVDVTQADLTVWSLCSHSAVAGCCHHAGGICAM